MATAHAAPINDENFRFSDENVAELVKRIKAATPTFRENAAQGEADRSPTAATAKLYDDLELWGLMVPRRWGGWALSSSGMFQVVRQLARADMSTAWVIQILNGTGWISTLTNDQNQEDLFSTGQPRICSSATPPGTATPVEGGYRVSGAWPYSSGCRQSNWGQFGVMIEQEDGTKLPGCFVYMPRSDFEIVDSWFSVGLQGTGSDTSVAKDVFVPEHRMIKSTNSFEKMDTTKRHFGAPSDYWPVTALIRSTFVGLAIGGAETLAEAIIERCRTKGIPTTVHNPTMNSPVAQHYLGEAWAKISSARIIAERACKYIDDAALERRILVASERAQLKGENAVVFNLIMDAAQQLMNIAGSSGFMLDNVYQRYWRDLNVQARHLACLPHVGFEVLGKSLFGIEPNIVPFGLY